MDINQENVKAMMKEMSQSITNKVSDIIAVYSSIKWRKSHMLHVIYTHIYYPSPF